MSGLTRCWATNLSTGGIGLTAFVGDADPPVRGDELELELTLGDSKTTIRAIARVAWTLMGTEGRIGLGAQFREMSPSARATLAMFLAEHRPRTLVVNAAPSEQALAHDALGDLDLEIVDDIAQLDEMVLRSCAAIVVFCQDPQRLVTILDAIVERGGSTTVPGDPPLAPVTVCTHMESESLLPMFSEGRVYQVLRPPFDRRSLRIAVERSCERWALQVELRWASLQLEGMAAKQRLQPNPHLDTSSNASHIIRASAEMQRVAELITTVAIHDVPVLLQGETGTGKELAAREIHARSKRANMPFVAQDCGALTETLLESELFGHVRGAFTGATTDNPGLFQIADEGTIFLDEIQNTSPALQAKLLRVVEQGEVRPVGGPKPKRVNVRLVAACNVDLRQAIKEGRFRSDFFYRLNRFPISLPPLREHVDDIIPLTRFFVQLHCETLNRSLHRVDPRVERALLQYEWPGNIRELKNTIERAILLTKDGEPIRLEVLPPEVRGERTEQDVVDRSLKSLVDDFERKVIQSALERNDGVVRRVARILDVNPVTLSRKMKKLGLV